MPRAAVSVPASRPSTAQELIYPTHGCRDVLRRHGIKPHDHARDNRRHIKELQQQVSERKAAEEAEAAKAASKAARRRAEGAYSAVPSRVAAQLAARPSSAPPSRHRPSPRNFYVGAPLQPAKQVTRAGRTAAWIEPPLLVPPPPPPAKSLPPPPLLEAAAEVEAAPHPASPPPTDYIARNIEAAKHASRRRQASARASDAAARVLFGRPEPAGKLPSYLIDRKLELAQRAAEKAAAAVSPEVPPHHHLLPREDCERVLADIRAARAELLEELDTFPFVVDTPTQKARHAQLTRELEQLDAAEAAFSRSKVVVADGPLPSYDRAAAS